MLIKVCAAGFILGLFRACESHFSGRCVRVGDLYRNTREELQVSVGVPVAACHTEIMNMHCGEFSYFSEWIRFYRFITKITKCQCFCFNLEPTLATHIYKE